MKTFNELLREMLGQMDTLTLQRISEAIGTQCRTDMDWQFLVAVDMEIQDREERNG